MQGDLVVTGEPAGDRLLNTDPLALLLGMLLDQQVPMEWAFSAPLHLQQRIGKLDASAIAAMTPEAVEEAFRQKPALHRYPGSMAKRAHAVCEHVVDRYGGRTEAIWTDAADGQDLYDRVRALPGFGEDKTRIFIALLAKRFGVRPEGWEAAAGPFADDTPRSVADIDSPEALQKVREFKKAQKAKGKSKAD